MPCYHGIQTKVKPFWVSHNVCLFSGLHCCRAHLSWLSSSNPCPLQKTHSQNWFALPLLMAEACNIWVVPSASTGAPPVRSLGLNEWWDRVWRRASRNLFCKHLCVCVCVCSSMTNIKIEKSWKNLIMWKYCNKRLWTLITGGTRYSRKHGVSAP